jgi:hypothetical protein
MLLLQGLQYDLIVHLPYIAIDSFIQARLQQAGIAISLLAALEWRRR